MTNMAMRPNPTRGYPGRTYRFYNGPVVFPFGHGLSYSTFSHSLAQAPSSVSVTIVSPQAMNNSTMASSGAVRLNHANCNTQPLGLHVHVKNTGSIDGPHTLLLFSTSPVGTWSPNKRLIAFEKVHVAAGCTKRVRFDVHVCKHLAVVDHFGIRKIPMGEHRFHVGDLHHSISLQPALDSIKT